MRTGLCGILCIALLAAWGGSPPTEELRLFYGSRTPVGLMAYVQVRPSIDRRKV